MRILKVFEGEIIAGDVAAISYHLPLDATKFELHFFGTGQYFCSFTKNNRKSNLIKKLNLNFPNNTLIYPIPLNLNDDVLTLKRLFNNKHSFDFTAKKDTYLKGTVKNTGTTDTTLNIYLKVLD